MKKALAPVKRRIRVQRAVKGLCLGLLLAAALAAGVMALSFLAPLPWRTQAMLGTLAALPFAVLIAVCLPVNDLAAAKRADACGLKERAQTALMLKAQTDSMAQLQRRDALNALLNFDPRAKMPLVWAKKTLIAACACALSCLILCFVPNPQDNVLRAWEKFKQEMEAPKALLEETAEQLKDDHLDDRNAQELRRMLGELARKMGQSRDAREALTALADTQRQLERLMSDSRDNAMNALSQAGLDSLAAAMNAENAVEAIEKALSEAENAEEVVQKLEEAAQNAANAAAQQALKSAAQALSQGNAAQAAGALSALSQSGAAASQIAAALQAARSMASGQAQALGQGSLGSMGAGQGQGSGTGQGQGGGQGQGAGGAGKGSTNEETPGGGASGAAQAGQGTSQYKMGEYERIYDPTRLGDGGEITQSTGEVGEGDRAEITLAPGLGDMSGYVPYDQVVGQYHETAVQRAREADLPDYARTWISDYFTALTDR